jgi:TonB family protein
MFVVTIPDQRAEDLVFVEILAFDEFLPPPPERPLVTTRPAAVLPRQPNPAQQPITQPIQEPAQAQMIDIPEVTIPDFQPVDLASLPERTDRNIRTNIHRTTIQDTLLLGTITSPIISDISQATNPGQTTPGHGLNLDGFADEIRTQAGHISQYRMEGDVINRTIVTRVIPEFPPGVNRNGSVTMEFTVVPNGSVHNITVTRRSEPEFEHVSVVAMRQWTFNRADRSHTGRITFNFILE